ncbi:MAG: hypothetical protein WCG01_02270 [bacterium]
MYCPSLKLKLPALRNTEKVLGDLLCDIKSRDEFTDAKDLFIYLHDQIEELRNMKLWQEIVNGKLDKCEEITELNAEVAEFLVERHEKVAARSTPLTQGPMGNINLLKGKRKSNEIYLRRLSHLTPEVAEQLGKHEGNLTFEALEELTPGAAEGLSEHVGTLNLQTFDKISVESLQKLDGHDGKIYLGDFKTYSKEALSALEDVKGDLRFGGVADVEAAKLLMQHNEAISLNCNITPEICKELVKFKGKLVIETNDPMTREMLCDLIKHKDYYLEIRAFKQPELVIDNNLAEMLDIHRDFALFHDNLVVIDKTLAEEIDEGQYKNLYGVTYKTRF